MANEQFRPIPSQPTVYDRHALKPTHERVLFGEGAFLQGADINEALSIERDQRTAIGDLIASDGDRLSGADVLVDTDAETVTVTAGVIYLLGAPRAVAAATLASVPMTGEIEIGVYVNEAVITSDQDADLLGLEPGTEGYQEPGAIRTRLVFSWGYLGDGSDGAFYRYVTINDGAIVTQDAPPTLTGVAAQIAVYDFDALGSYIVRGCTVSALGLYAGKQVFDIAAGVANVTGVKVRRPAATRFEVTEDPDLGTVDAEPQLFTGTGTATITTRHSPISAITSAIVTKQRTVTLTKGVSGATDALPDDGVTALISVVQGGTTYVATTDYVQSGDGVSWAPAGAEPTTGSSYQVTYQYLDAITPDSFTATTVTLSGGVTDKPVFLGYAYKLPRTDLLCVGPDGAFQLVKGESAAVNPQPPAEPATLLALAQIRNTWFGTAPVVVNDGVSRVTFATMARYFDRLIDLVDEAGLNKLRQDAAGAAPGAGNAIFADPLTDDDYRDAGEAQTGAVFDGLLQLAVDPTFHSLNQAGPLLLDYTTAVVVAQEFVTGCVRVNPFQNFTPAAAKLKISPSQDFWTEKATTWLSDQTKIFGTGSIRTVTGSTVATKVTENAVRTLREIDVTFTITGFGVGETLDGLIFDGHDVTPAGPLVGNASGIITSTFTIPAGVAAGSKALLAFGGSGAHASAIFTGRGVLETTTLQRTTTVQLSNPVAPPVVTPPTIDPPPRVPPAVVAPEVSEPWRDPWRSDAASEGAMDPQAQTFALAVAQHVASVEIKVCAVGNRNVPVIVELVQVDNGYPTTTVIAQTEINMNTVVVGAWTRFAFAVPVFLPANTMFAFVVKTNDANHSISIADLGAFDAGRQRWVTRQPYTVGDRFDSSNAQSWQVHSNSDITFRLNAPRFATAKTINLGTVAVTDCSDLMIAADVYLPTAETSVVFEVTFGSEAPVRLRPYQNYQRTDYYTGNVTVKAILTGTTMASPVVAKDITLISGKIRTSATYVSTAWPMGTGVRIDAAMSTKLPVGSALAAEVDAANDVWAAMTLASSAPIDDGFTEQTFTKTGHTAANGGRLKLTLTGGPNARPQIGDLRAYKVI